MLLLNVTSIELRARLPDDWCILGEKNINPNKYHTYEPERTRESGKDFDRLLRRVNEWCKTRADNISACYLAFAPDGLKLFVITKGSAYRFDLDDAVSELDIELAQTFERCPTDVIHFPEAPIESLSSFFDTGKAIQIYGD